jgi:hypothetical protein
LRAARTFQGTIEVIHLDGEGEYLFYVASSLSDESGL